MKLGRQYREAQIRAEDVNAEDRTVTLSFSSEAAVERYWGVEILDHGPGSVRLNRINNGGPLLLNHDTDDLIGVVESTEIRDRKCYAKVRFSKSEAGQAALEDVRDGIRRNVSVGYNVHKVRLESESEGQKTYRVMDWEPLEVSLVSVPADSSVGVGRDHKLEEHEVQIERMGMSDENKEKPAPTPEAPAKPSVEVNQRALADEKARVANILKFGEKFNCEKLAREAVVNGRSFEEVRDEWFEKHARKASPAPELVTMEQEAKRNYSFLRVAQALARGQNPEGFEAEVHQELVKNLSGSRKRAFQGFVMPSEMFGIKRRTMTAGTGSAGGYTVATDILGSEFVSKLDNPPVVERAGARRLSGLVGDIVLPKQTGGATAYWLGEGDTVSTSDLAFGQIVMTPHRLQVVLPMTKQLMTQSSLDVEALSREDAQKRLNIAIDLAALQGSGVDGEPKGLFNFDTSTSGINTVTFGAAAAFAKINEAIAAIGTDNVMGTPTWLIDWTSWAKWRAKSLDTGSGRFLWEGTGESGNVTGYPGLVSQHLPSNKSVVGVFSDMLIGFWDGVDVLVDPYSRKKEGIIELSADLLCDIVVRYPQSFCVSTDSAAQ